MNAPAFPIPLDAALIDEFQSNGFVTTPDVLNTGEVTRFAEAVDAEIARRTAHDHRTVAEKTIYEQSFIQCMRLWETSPAVADLSFHAGMAGIAAQLLQVASVIMWQDQALYKEAGGRETTPHQDQTFWPLDDAPLISAWIPFDEVTIENGAMAYVSGSHKAGRLKVVDITHTTDPYDILNDSALQDVKPTVVPVRPGSVIWHHGLTVHEAAANISSSTRRVFTIVYLSSEARRAKGWPEFSLDRAGVEVGGIVGGEGLPRLWPPLQERPDPPELISDATGPQGYRQ